MAKLKETDAEVKAHEQAHKSATGGLRTSVANYETEKGPDGREYAVAGEVGISFTEGTDAKKNLENAQTLKRAALAPSEPSAQDRAIAQKADSLIRKYKQEIARDSKKTNEESKTENDDKKSIITEIEDSKKLISV